MSFAGKRFIIILLLPTECLVAGQKFYSALIVVGHF